MAQKRMFNIDITECDAFLDMPLTAQALYFHLGMNADDDGFLSAPKRVQRCCGASVDDLRILVAKGFLLPFDNGVMVIIHWHMMNRMRRDMYKPTRFTKEAATLIVDSKTKAYRLRTPEDDEEPVLIEAPKKKQPAKKKATANKYPEECKEIIDYLNSVTGSSFNPKTKDTTNHICARLDEGRSVEDFKKVIDTKAAQWLNNKDMRSYLRPSTLFRPKNFENYLNESRFGDLPPQLRDDNDFLAAMEAIEV